MNFRVLFPVSLCACLLGVFAACRPPPPAAALPVLGPAPAWRLPDAGGRMVSSADFAGQVVLVNFWATWCEPCRQEIPGFLALEKKYSARGLVVLGFSLDRAGPDAVRKFAAEQGMDYPLLLADDHAVGAFGMANGRPIPTTFLIDREGRIRHVQTGVAPAEEYARLVASLFP